MLQNIWILQVLVMISVLFFIFIICILTDLPTVLGLSFSKKETIEKYIEKKIVFKSKVERNICTFRIIGSKSFDRIEEVYIFMCICKYKKQDKKLITIDEDYRHGIVTITRKFGIYNVIDVKTTGKNQENNYPEEITSTDEYKEIINIKNKRFLKEANLKKAKRKFKLKKAFKV
ncbi:hypothetical protein ACQPU1_00100 [Clostridium paraputrificum]|uniref:hypothetical protein n=1 Tax=Clostridium TaxID=1485 RepID=UPI003D337B11